MISLQAFSPIEWFAYNLSCGFYDTGSEGAMQSDGSFPAGKQMSAPRRGWPQTARFVKSPLNSPGEKPSPDGSERTVAV